MVCLTISTTVEPAATFGDAGLFRTFQRGRMHVVATKVGKQLAVDAIEGFFAASGATFTNSALSSPKSNGNRANNEKTSK